MIKVTVMYPAGKDMKFDIAYYCNTHMPMVQKKVGAALKKLAVEQGIAGGAPGSSPTYLAFGHLYFDSLEAFQSAFAPHAESIMADIPNYTNTQPLLQISEVKL
ncbi:MAG: ethyl tert-butyl ether degradation protein EthD [Nevskia sp.]|nr:ethyl tert-butyl ether degradation protein EthD [Nevskia sp.]